MTYSGSVLSGHLDPTLKEVQEKNDKFLFKAFLKK